MKLCLDYSDRSESRRQNACKNGCVYFDHVKIIIWDLVKNNFYSERKSTLVCSQRFIIKPDENYLVKAKFRKGLR